MTLAQLFTFTKDHYKRGYVLTIDGLDLRLLQRAITVALAQVATGPETNYTSMLRELALLLVRVQDEPLT